MVSSRDAQNGHDLRQCKEREGDVGEPLQSRLEPLAVPRQAANPRSTTHRRGSNTNPRLTAGSLTTFHQMPCAAASASACSPVYPLSTKAISTVCPVASCTAAARSATYTGPAGRPG